MKDNALNRLFQVVGICIVDWHNDCYSGHLRVLFQEARSTLTCDEVADVHAAENLLSVVVEVNLVTSL